MSEAQDGLPPGRRRWAIITQAMVIALSVLDGSIANIALPSIAHDLNVTAADSIWVVNAYQIAVTISLLPLASLGDIYGYRHVYRWGLVLFLIGSAACGLSTSLPMLAVSRLMQGVGAAGMMGVNTALVRFIYPRDQLGRGIGMVSLVVAVSAAAGPTLAAGILSFGPWPWLFFINLPIGVVALAMVGTMPVTPKAAHRFDLRSAALNAATFGLLIAALDGFGHGGQVVAGVGLLMAGLAVGFVFVRSQMAVAAPILPVDLFRLRAFGLSVLTSVCAFIAASMTMVSLPFLFEARGFSTLETGLLITPWPVMSSVMAPIAGRLSDKVKAGKLGGIGLLIMAVGLVSAAAVPIGASFANVAWRLALCGGGFALFQAPNNRLLITSAPPERSGAASGMLSTARLLGQTNGAALVALVFGLSAASGVELAAETTIGIAAGFALIATLVSVLRLRV